jgi:DNA-binding winged helix-turn-helix (wHTH) protein/tetratricopeptide (TPR) repeat protein
MAKGRWFAFGPFTLDVVDERLWNREQSVPLGQKAFTVLVRLLKEPNQLVTKEQLLAAAWPDTAVSEAVLTTAMREIRVAVGDPARTPRFIETVHGRGYRFIGPLVATNDDPRPGALPGHRLTPPAAPVGGSLVGRSEEWAQLREWFAAAQQGTRRIGFVCGEAGIGKTALVDAFVGALEGSAVRIARGQCIEQFGAGEPYLPVLEALGRLTRDPDAAIGRVLRDCAPSWLAHFPALASAEGDPPPPVRPQRMLRELTDAIEALTAAKPLILVLEDLQWSDNATVDWLAYAARRRDTARLLVLGTYRPLEAVLHAAPLRRVIAELRHHTQMSELVLDYLSRDEVATLLRRRCGALGNIEELADVLHRRTGGHPLFLAGIVDELIRSLKTASEPPGLDPSTVAQAIPLNVRRFIEYRLEQVSAEDRQILEPASVAGEAFAAAAVAAGTMLSEEHVQRRCDLLRAAGLLVEDGVVRWPDGTVGARYRFRHALFRETAYAGISPQRRAGLHLRIGEWLESTFAGEASSMAAELAVHFEQGLHVSKAVSYLQQASRNAVHRSAYTEALRHVVRALDLVETLPDGLGRRQRDAALTLLQAQVLETTSGWGSEDVARAYAKARELSLVLEDQAGLLQSTWGLIANCLVRADLDRTQALCRSLLALAKKRENALFRMAAHFELGGTALVRGRTASARRHFHLAEALHDPGEHRSAVAAFGMDLGIFARIWSTHVMWYEGWPDRAYARAADTIRMSEAVGHPFTHTITLAYGAMLAQFRRDVPEVDRLTSAVIALATEHGFPYYRAWAEVLRAWSLAEQGAGGEVLDDMRRSIETLGTTAGLRLPYYSALLAEACGRFGRVDEGLDVLSSAFRAGSKSSERWWDPELYRIKGELLLKDGAANHREAERCFRTAIDLGRAQGARVLELRATVSLARLWQSQRQSRESRRVLTRIYGDFTEGFGDADLADARALLVGSKSTSQ